jgi:hypothetical protein
MLADKPMWPNFSELFDKWKNQKHCQYLSDCPHIAEYLIKEQIPAEKEIYRSNWGCEEHRNAIINAVRNQRNFSVTYYKNGKLSSE